MLLFHFILLLASGLEATPTRPHAVACQGVVRHMGYHPGVVMPKHRKPHLRAGPLRAASSSDNSCQNSDASKGPNILSPVLSIKRALESDNVQLYKAVLFNLSVIEMSEAKRQRYLAQLPALVAQYDAKRIWDVSNFNREYPLYKGWIERSKSHHFDIGIDDRGVTLKENTIDNGIPHVIYQYDEQWWTDNLNADRKISDILAKWMTPPTFLNDMTWNNNPKGLHHILGRFFAKKPKPPTVFDIARVLEMEDHVSRKHQISLLQENIEKVLSEGVYIMDDIIGTSSISFLLLWRYIDDQDPAVRELIRFLIKEGAPVSEKNIFLFYSHFTHLSTTTNEDRLKYKKVAELIVEYASGSPEQSLAHILKTLRLSSRYASMLHIIEACHSIFPTMNFSDLLLVQSLGKLVSRLHKNKLEHISDQVIDLFARYGLVPLDVDKAYWKLVAERFPEEDTRPMEEALAGILERLAHTKHSKSS